VGIVKYGREDAVSSDYLPGVIYKNQQALMIYVAVNRWESSTGRKKAVQAGRD
jgi:hypothetical protein